MALRYAAAIARGSRGRLTVLSVTDPLLASAAAAAYVAGTGDKERNDELRHFVSGALRASAGRMRSPKLVVTKGQPAQEIVKVAAREGCDLFEVCLVDVLSEADGGDGDLVGRGFAREFQRVAFL